MLLAGWMAISCRGPVGTPVATLEIRDLATFQQILDDAVARGEYRVILITMQGCYPCEELLRDVPKEHLIHAHFPHGTVTEALKAVNRRLKPADGESPFYRSELPGLLVITRHGWRSYTGYISKTRCLGPASKSARERNMMTPMAEALAD